MWWEECEPEKPNAAIAVDFVFVAVPSALAFATGCVAGMDSNVCLYHWFPDMKTYVKVLRVSRNCTNEH